MGLRRCGLSPSNMGCAEIVKPLDANNNGRKKMVLRPMRTRATGEALFAAERDAGGEGEAGDAAARLFSRGEGART